MRTAPLKREREWPHGRPKRRWQNNIPLDVNSAEWEYVVWNHLAQVTDRWPALVNTVMNVVFHKMRGVFWLSERLLASQQWLCSKEILSSPATHWNNFTNTPHVQHSITERYDELDQTFQKIELFIIIWRSPMSERDHAFNHFVHGESIGSDHDTLRVEGPRQMLV